MNPSTATGLRLAALACLLLFIAAHALTLATDTADGFCWSLQPCHTTEGAPQ